MRGRDVAWSRARRAIAWSIAASMGASLALACASIIGIGDRLLDDVTPDADATDERAVVTDDGPTTPATCPPTAKCVDVPAGWQLTSLSPNQRPACADGYGAPEDLVVAPDGLGCTCKCTETTPGSCAGAATTTTFRDYPAAGCSASTSTYALTVLDGGCGTLPITTTPAVRVPTAAAAPPECAADAGPSRFVDGRACAAQGTACNDGGMCAGALPAGELLCVSQAGEVACPAGFAKKFPVGTATGADDRQCGTCTCTPATTCDTPIVELFSSATCTDAGLAVPASGSCTNVDAGESYGSYRYTGRAPGCQPSVPPPPGRWSDHQGRQDHLLHDQGLTRARTERARALPKLTARRRRAPLLCETSGDFRSERRRRTHAATGVGVAASRRVEARAR